MPGNRMSNNVPLSRLWNVIAKMDSDILDSHKFALGYLYGCDAILGLKPHLNIRPIEIVENPMINKKPAFKNMDIAGIQYLRSLVFKQAKIDVVTDWAETIMRFLEINHAILKKKCTNTFDSILTGRITMLELTALLMDCHFAWHDLRYLNIVLKLMDQHWLYSFDGREFFLEGRKHPTQINLMQFRLLIMREAALKNISGGFVYA